MPLRHRPGYAVDLHQGLPAKRDNRPRSSSPGTARPVRTATQPISARFELVEALKGFTPLVPHVHLSRSLTGPMPSGSTGTSRRCRGCSHPHPRLRGQAASNFKRPATTGHRRSPSTPHGQTAPRGARRVASGSRAVAGPAIRVHLPSIDLSAVTVPTKPRTRSSEAAMAAIMQGDQGAVAITRGTAERQVGAPSVHDRFGSQADSAGSIPVTRSGRRPSPGT
jgi:hypothetical protein